MKPIEIVLVVLFVFQVCMVAPLLMVLKDHVVRLEIRTESLCQRGLPKPDYVGPIRPDGCLP